MRVTNTDPQQALPASDDRQDDASPGASADVPRNPPRQANGQRSSTSARAALAPDEGPSATTTIYGKDAIAPPRPAASLAEREQLADAYSARVKTQLANIESGSEAERNVKFVNARPFTTPAGYFGGGLLAAGYDPDERINATFSSFVGMGRPQTQTAVSTRSYSAAEVAAGMLAHDQPDAGGVVNFQTMSMSAADRAKVENLQTLGKRLQDHWEQDVAAPMRDPSGPLAMRSGRADAYTMQATLNSLRGDPRAFGQLSAAGQQAINRTLDHAGQVIVPNVYGYPIAGHAFIPYEPYDHDYEHRPNQGLMMNLNNGTISEIKGDNDFANWARQNRDDLLQSFNARDLQGGLDAHWPKAGDVLDNLIGNEHVTYRGYWGALADQDIPVRELFNYTRARGDDYLLKFGNNDGSGLAAQYQAVNAKNAAWADQTQVFGSAAQTWKAVKGTWAATVGNVPLIGNLGNMVFGVHDSLTGMTPNDRIGGNVGAALSTLQLLHELAPAGAGAAALAKPSSVLSGAANGGWKFNPAANEFRFMPPQRVNGQVGYPMSPTKGPRLPADEPAGSVEAGGREASAQTHGTSPGLAGEEHAPSADEEHQPLLPKAGSLPTIVPTRSAPGTPGAGAAGARPVGAIGRTPAPGAAPQGPVHAASTPALAHPPADSPEPGRSGKPAVAVPAPGRDAEPTAEPTPGPSRAADGNGAPATAENAAPLSKPEDTGFKKHFPGGLAQAESYLKGKSLGMIRSPTYLSSDRYAAPRSWGALSNEALNKQVDRYLSVWDPRPLRADFGSEEEFHSSLNAYNDRIGKYRQSDRFDIEDYWNDMVSSQNDKYRAAVDNETKRLALATKAYDDFMAHPGQYRVKPDDPYQLRKQMTGKQDGKRDAMHLQREALDFGPDSLYKLDKGNTDELRSHFLQLFGRDSSKIEEAFMLKKSQLEDELYAYAGTKVSRDDVESKKKALQSRFNSGIEMANKNMDLMYKRIALYGTLGALSISGLSAILWKAIDEIRGNES